MANMMIVAVKVVTNMTIAINCYDDSNSINKNDEIIIITMMVMMIELMMSTADDRILL